MALLLAVLVSGYIVRALPIPLPLPIVQIVLGWIISNRLHQGVGARYQYLVARLNLAALVNRLGSDDVRAVNAYLTVSP